MPAGAVHERWACRSPGCARRCFGGASMRGIQRRRSGQPNVETAVAFLRSNGIRHRQPGHRRRAGTESSSSGPPTPPRRSVSWRALIMDLDYHELFSFTSSRRRKYMAALEEGLLQLEQNPTTMPLIAEILRVRSHIQGKQQVPRLQVARAFGHEVEEMLDRFARVNTTRLRADLTAPARGRRPEPVAAASGVGVNPWPTTQLELHADPPLRKTPRRSRGRVETTNRGHTGRDCRLRRRPTHRRRTCAWRPRIDRLLDLVGEISIAAQRVWRHVELTPRSAARRRWTR